MSHTESMPDNVAREPLEHGWGSVLKSWRFDLISGFLVFLIALPLCLAIAKASSFPPIAGLMTAVVGGMVTVFISDSELTIKGPAAGLIVIVAECVASFAHEFGSGLPEHEAMMIGYRMALGVGVASGILQALFGLARLGKISDFFPRAAVHGMLASIGIIIFSKQAYVVMGVDAPKDTTPLGLLIAMPAHIAKLNPEIALIGFVSLVILFGMPLLRWKWAKVLPSPMLVLLVALPMGRFFDLEHEHTYLFSNGFFSEGAGRYAVGPRFLVDMPEVLSNPSSAFAFPDFHGLFTLTGLKFLAMFAIVGSLESLLSAEAIDMLDPWRRKTNFNRDLLGIGVANTLAASVGGLPMISEIVRSSANINNGARTRGANFFHAAFILGFAVLLPNLIHQIPLAALGAMLVFTGYRLASPKEFVSMYRVGPEQLVIFLTTMIVTLSTDLLVGILAGIAIKYVIHLMRGMPIRTTLRPDVRVEEHPEEGHLVSVSGSAVFSNWIGLRSRLEKYNESERIVLDLSETRLVDHTVMEKLSELKRQFADSGRRLEVVGLHNHKPLSRHPNAARRRVDSAESLS